MPWRPFHIEKRKADLHKRLKLRKLLTKHLFYITDNFVAEAKTYPQITQIKMLCVICGWLSLIVDP
jgi:hypothetical protein